MKKGFSLVELLICIIVVSLLFSIVAPVVSKKMKSSSVALFQADEITTDCENPDCELCTKKYCIKCALDSCAKGQYAETKKCKCSSCSDFGENCSECDSKGCTKCSNTKMYIKEGKCLPCPSGSWCDGTNLYSTCPGDGYWCDDSGVYKCKDTYQSVCITCTSQSCSTCEQYYYFNTSTKKCERCEVGHCIHCSNKTYCTECDASYIYDPTTHSCDYTCSSKITGCQYCSSATVCTQCIGGYFLNSSKGCTLCSVENCSVCAENQSSPVCASCNPGYYLSSGKCYSCSSKFGEGCVSCDSSKCLSCEQGKHINSQGVCEDNDNKYACSDSNFMQIGSLCVTRRNMGDSATLSIPSTVKVVDVGEYCYWSNAKCCWRGKTATDTCDSANGDYSGCTRTVCTYDAAKEICAKFNYLDKTWRLPKRSEMSNWLLNSSSLASNGLMLCDEASGFSSSLCSRLSKCPGSYGAVCIPAYLWSSDTTTSLNTHIYRLHMGVWFASGAHDNGYPFSVRCVSEM